MNNLKFITAILIICFTASCSKKDLPPPAQNVVGITTDTPTEITSTTAKLGGNISTDGGSPVTKKGICISLTANPTIDDPNNDEVYDGGDGLGAFSGVVTDLPSSTIGHVRAFAVNANGTFYGENSLL